MNECGVRKLGLTTVPIYIHYMHAGVALSFVEGTGICLYTPSPFRPSKDREYLDPSAHDWNEKEPTPQQVILEYSERPINMFQIDLTHRRKVSVFYYT